MKKLITLILLVTGTSFAQEKTASEKAAYLESTFFHPAAAHYIQGQNAAASNLVVKGLSIDPDDEKLLKLKKLIDQQQKDQKNKDQQDKNQDQKNKDKKNKDQDQKNKDQKQQNDQQKQDQNKDQKDQQDKEQPQDPQQQEPEKNGNEQQPPKPQPQPTADQMTPEEAAQLLDAMKQEEQNKRLQMHPVLGAPIKVDKDW